MLTLLVLSGVRAGPKKQKARPKKALPPMPDDDSEGDGEAGPFDLLARARVAAHVFERERENRIMCIRQRIEWYGLLLGSDHEELLAMTVADL